MASVQDVKREEAKNYKNRDKDAVRNGLFGKVGRVFFWGRGFWELVFSGKTFWKGFFGELAFLGMVFWRRVFWEDVFEMCFAEGFW